MKKGWRSRGSGTRESGEDAPRAPGVVCSKPRFSESLGDCKRSATLSVAECRQLCEPPLGPRLAESRSNNLRANEVLGWFPRARIQHSSSKQRAGNSKSMRDDLGRRRDETSHRWVM